MSDKKVPQNELEVKHPSDVIECGTLEIFLPFFLSTPVLAMPLQRTYAFNNHKVQQWAVHITAYAHAYDAICYCTFLAAEVVSLGRTAQLTFPIHSQCDKQIAIGQGNQMQQELLDTLETLLRRYHRIDAVMIPARYRIPDEWVWSVRSTTKRLVYRDNHWQIVEE